MPNESVDIIGDVVNPARGSDLDLSRDFEDSAPAKPAPQPQSNGGEQVVEIDDVSVDELREIVTERRATKAAVSFVADHAQDYAATPQNEAVLTHFLEQNNLPFSRENLELAFENVKARLERPGTPTKAAPRRPASSGISDHDGGVIVTPTAETVEQEAWNMPLSQLRQQIQSRAYSAGAFGKPTQRMSHSTDPDY